jgi:hypothetical protein
VPLIRMECIVRMCGGDNEASTSNFEQRTRGCDAELLVLLDKYGKGDADEEVMDSLLLCLVVA